MRLKDTSLRVSLSACNGVREELWGTHWEVIWFLHSNVPITWGMLTYLQVGKLRFNGLK